jgi:ABC-2 type transport system ATP-binding protein
MRISEAMELFAAFYSRTVDGDALLKRLQLWEKKDAPYATLSGGQKQRLAIALALINEPQLLFLDEPTTGLDPQVRLEIRDLIEELRAEKRTILMTTHYIEEAERLCDRVAIIDAGQIIALGSPRELQEKSAEQSSIEIKLTEPLRDRELPQFVHALQTTVEPDGRHVALRSSHPAKTLVELVKWIDAQGYELEDVHLRRPTLEDVFIEMTGKKLRE